MRERPRHRGTRFPVRNLLRLATIIVLVVFFYRQNERHANFHLRIAKFMYAWETHDEVVITPTSIDSAFPFLAGFDDEEDGGRNDTDPGVISETGMHPGAFVYLVHNLSEHGRGELIKSIESLQEHVYPETMDSDGSRVPYNIVLFVEDRAWFATFRWRFPRFRIELVVIDPAEWAVPGHASLRRNSTTGELPYPDRWEFPSGIPADGSPLPPGAGFSVSYRQMSRYAAGYMVRHPALAKYEHVIKLDPDTRATGPWLQDPFMHMSLRRIKLGYWIAMEHPGPGQERPGVTEHMGEHFSAFVSKTGAVLQSPQLAFRPPHNASDSEFRSLLFYGCFVAFDPAEFRSSQYRELFEHMDQAGGFFKYRWDEQYFYTMYAALAMVADEDIEFFDYVQVMHPPESRPRPIPPNAPMM